MDEVVAIAGVFGTASVFIVTTARVYLRRLEILHGSAPAELMPHVERRLARIEQAVDAIAMEVERVSEGQRFAARLLAERSPIAPLAGTPPRLNTPH